MVNRTKLAQWYDKKEKELKGIKRAGYIMYFYDKKNCETKPIEEIVPVITMGDTKELFLLDTPTFYENGLPVFALLRGFPLSLQFEFKARKFIENSETENLMKALNEPDDSIEENENVEEIDEEEPLGKNKKSISKPRKLTLKEKADKVSSALNKTDDKKPISVNTDEFGVVCIEKGCSSFDLNAKLDSVYTNKIFAKKEIDRKYYFFTAFLCIIVGVMTWMMCKIYLPVITEVQYVYLLP